MSIFKTAAADEVKTKQLSKEGCRINVSVEATPQLITKSFQNAAVQVQARAQMQGFRTGKVPLDLVKQNFAANIKERALDLAIRSAIAAAVEQLQLAPVTVPALTKADFASFNDGQSFSFELAVDVAPEFDVKDYKGIPITKKPETASEEEVKARLDLILQNNARLESAPEGAVVDEKVYAAVQYTGKRNGKDDAKLSADNELIDMSAPQTLPELAKAVLGMKKGESKDFEAKEGEDTLSFHVTVEDIKNKVVPVLNDSFAKDMGFETLDALKKQVQDSMNAEAKENSQRDFTHQIEDHLVKMNNFPLPQTLVDEYTNSSLENFLRNVTQLKPGQLNEEQRKGFEERIRPTVEKDLRIGYIIHAIAKKENLQASEADWQAELDKSLTANAKNKEDEKKIRAFFQERKDHILATLNERKVFDFLKKEAVVK